MIQYGVLVALMLHGGGPARPADGGIGAVISQRVSAVQDTAYGCLRCHADKRRSFMQGVHSERDIRCHECHGGDPRAVDTEAAHRGTRFDPESKTDIARLCSSCHSDPDQMRQYGLPAGEMAEFRTSRHGQVLFEGNTDAPTCTDCHDAHTILRATDARSTIHPTNIPATCARCHEDAGMMQKYGLPIDQFERYREGAHGVAVFESGNFAAPTCVGCHGSHSALPPKSTEISTVCDRCHVLLGGEFHDSPHGLASRAGSMPGCQGCHLNHGTDVSAPEEIATLCTNCHAADSDAARVGIEIQTEVMNARQELQMAEHAIEELARAGRRVTDARFRYRSAYTAWGEMKKAQHNLNTATLGDLGRQVSSISREIRETAEASEEHRWERRILLFPVWFMALSAIALAGYRLMTLRRSES